MARRRSKKKSRKKLKKPATPQKPVSRQDRKWSVNSSLFHSRDCPAVERISKANIRSGVAPDSLKPHDCVLASQIENAAHDAGAGDPAGLSTSAPVSVPQAIPAAATIAHVGAESGAAAGALSRHGDSDVKSCVDPINPYCRCNPCKCTSPCTCGLRKTESQSQTQWDSNQQLLRHIMTAIYRPDPAKILKSKPHHDDGGGVTSNEQSPVRHAVVAVDYALSQSGNSQIRHAMVKNNVLDDTGTGSGVHSHASSVRKAEHHGNQIELKTMYEVFINGEPLNVHIGVLNDGNVHCHSIPNYSSVSGIELIKAIIDAFPDDYPSRD